MKDAGGHGSNAHGGGVAAVGNVKLHPSVLQTITKNPGGFSVKPGTGAQPSGGYMVSIPGHTQIVDEASLRGPQGPGIIQSYANAHAGALQDPKAHIGGWTDSATGKTYLDVSHNIGNRRDAVASGKAHNQIAIYDVKRGQEIKTGGTGE